MRILDAIAIEKKGTYEVCTTATLQEDSQGRDKDGKSVKRRRTMLVTNNKRGGGRERHTRSRQLIVSAERAGETHEMLTLQMSEPVKGIIESMNKWVGCL